MIWGGRGEGGSGLEPWLIHVNVWQNQYSIVKQNKVKIKIKKKNKTVGAIELDCCESCFPYSTITNYNTCVV